MNCYCLIVGSDYTDLIVLALCLVHGYGCVGLVHSHVQFLRLSQLAHSLQGLALFEEHARHLVWL